MDDTRPLVLVVDDDGGIRGLLRALLEDDGYAVTTSENGADALATLAQLEAPPALILLDLRMPVMDGPAFAQRYLQGTLSPAPIVLLTGDARHPEATAWALDRITKPFDIDRLLGAVRRALAP